MGKLLRSKDRKVANAVMPSGKTARIANTFGLPAGKEFACPGATSVCETICYAGKLEKIFKGVKAALVYNWEQLKDEDQETMRGLLKDMIDDFRSDCEKHGAEKLFRIHWDGDFFNEEYTAAWKEVIVESTDIQFWVYTRSAFAVPILTGLPNLGLYFSADAANIKLALELKRTYGVQLAYLAKNFAAGKLDLTGVSKKAAIPCPENAGKLPMISATGSACVTCGQCVFARNDILFSASKS